MLKYLLVVAALAVLAASCSGDDVVATVNGSPITLDEVQRLEPESDEPIPLDRFNTLLRALIVQEIVTQFADSELGVTVGEAEVEAEYQTIKQGIEGQGNDYEQYLADNNTTDALIREVAFQQALQIQITDALVSDVPPLSDDDLQVTYQAQLMNLAQVCARHILVESEEEANAAVGRLSQGEDFATLAIEMSIGPSGPNGGDLGCAAPSAYVIEFGSATMDAEIGQPVGPVQTQFGWHVILVESRTIPTLEEARELLDTRRTQGPTLFTNWLVASITAADVEVEPQYGTWSIQDLNGDGRPDATVIPPER